MAWHGSTTYKFVKGRPAAPLSSRPSSGRCSIFNKFLQIKMLRTIIIRNEVSRRGLNKIIRSNITRCLSTELARRKQNKLLSPTYNQVLATVQWVTQSRCYSSLPTHSKVNLPALSPTMESGSIISWEKKEGDKLNEGDLLCEIETDKATMGFETPEEGYLAKILIPAGTKGVPVGKLLCIIVENDADVAAFKDFKDEASSSSAAAPSAPSSGSDSTPSDSTPAPAPAAKPKAPAAEEPPADQSHSRIYASPMARRLAEIKNIRLQGSGSGLYGSLKSTDLAGMAAQTQDASAAAAAPAPRPTPGQAYVDVPLSSMRATIAKRLTQAKQSIPHYQLTVTVEIDKTMAMRQAVNDKLAKEKAGLKVSINDFIIKAVASACRRVPAVNAHWMDTFIRQFTNVDVSVAVATPSGLITPIVFEADARGLVEISRNMKELADRAKNGRLKPEEFQGGTVTVSNLGMYGITMFNAIINPPQSLILACGGLQELVVPDSSKPEGWRVAKCVSFTASADHRVIDGAVGAQWMKAFKENMEDPANIIL